MVRQLRANRTLIAGQSYADRQAGMIQVRRKAVTCTYPSRVRCKEVTCTYLSQVHILAGTYPSRVRILAGTYPSQVRILAVTYPSRLHILAPSIPNSICANFYSPLKLNIHSKHCIVLRLSSLRIQQQNMRQEFIDAQSVSVSSAKLLYPPYQ